MECLQLGKNTVDCMKSGVVYSSTAAINGLTDRLEEEVDGDVTVVATGGLVGKIVPHCRRKIIRDDHLLLKGLEIIYWKWREKYESAARENTISVDNRNKKIFI